MLRWIVALLLLIPLLDIVVLIRIAAAIGAPATVALVVLTGLVGLLLVRAEGRHTLRRLQRKLVMGEPPTDELLDGGLLIAAGAFLLTPGVVTDAVGLLFVLPPSRYVVRGALKRYVVVPLIDAGTGGFATGEVYTFGFPDDSSGSESGEVYDVDPDAYDVDLDEDGEEGNA